MQTDIDEGLYSRQLYVLGHEAMRRMQVRSPAKSLLLFITSCCLVLALRDASGGIQHAMLDVCCVEMLALIERLLTFFVPACRPQTCCSSA